MTKEHKPMANKRTKTTSGRRRTVPSVGKRRPPAILPTEARAADGAFVTMGIRRETITPDSSDLAVYNHIKACDIEFRGRISLALVAWRCADADPRVEIREALELAMHTATICSRFGLRQQPQNVPFSFASACQFAYLLHSDFPQELVRLLTSVSHWVEFPHTVYECADSGLVYGMLKNHPPRGWGQLVDAAFRGQKSLRLYPDSFDSYMDIILHTARNQRTLLPALIEAADRYYDAREQDETYREFDQRDGAATYNAVRVDFRLATIIKWAYRDYPTERGQLTTIHRWPYD